MPADCRCQAGFTLLELLVALTLMALLAGLLFGGLSFGTRAWERGESELQTLDEVQIARSVIRRQLSRAFPSRLEVEDGEERIAFAGSRTSVWFVGPAPVASVPGALYRLGLRTDSAADGELLGMAWGSFDRSAQILGEDGGDKTAILLKRVASVDFQFFGVEREGMEPRWVSDWQGLPHLPSLIRVRVEFEDGDRRRWPDLVVAPMVKAR